MKTPARPLAAVAAAVLLVLGADPAPAATTPAATMRLRRAGDDFEAASKAEQVAVQAVTAAATRRSAAEAQLHALDATVARLDGQARAAAADLARLELARHNVEAEVHRAERRAAVARARVRRSAVLIYRDAGATSPLASITSAQSISTRTRRDVYREYAGDLMTEHVDELRVAEADARDARRALRERRDSVVRAQAGVQQELARVTSQRQVQLGAVATVRVEEAREQAALTAARSRRAEFERAAAASRVASGTIEQMLRARPVAGGRPGTLRVPADGPLTSRFGPRLHPIFHTVRMHTGIDIGAGYGAPVRAAAAGTVVVAGPASGYGNAVVVDHGGGLATLYGHLSRISVRVGAHVGAGQQLGAVGNTGNSTGPHLHFEVRVNGTPVDPLAYL